MIQGYADHAANERTFLAWVRTGVAVIAFGFVIEKFNIFLLTLAAAAGDAAQRAQFQRLAGSVGRYEGLAFMFGGIAIIALATTRFVRTTRLIDAEATYSARDITTELLVSAALIVLVAVYGIYLAFN